MKWHGVVADYDVPERFHALLNNAAASRPLTCEEVIDFYGWLRNMERRAISKRTRKERRALARAVLSIPPRPATACGCRERRISSGTHSVGPRERGNAGECEAHRAPAGPDQAP